MIRTFSPLASLASLLVCSGALAQGVDTGGTPHGGSRSQGTLWLPSAQLLPSGAWDVTFGYEHEGTVVRAAQTSSEVRGGALTSERRWIADRDLGAVSVSVGLADRLELGAVLPLLFGQSVSDVDGVVTPLADAAGLGDVHLAARLSLLGPQRWGERGWRWTMQGGLSAPSGTTDAAFGEDAARFDAATTATFVSGGPWAVTGHLGYQSGQALAVADQLFGDRLGAGMSFAWRHRFLQASVDAITRVNIGGKLDEREPGRAALELLAGLRYLGDFFFVDLGAGGAPLDDGLTPRWRVQLVLGAHGRFGEAEKNAEADPDPDHDGILGEAERCPNQPEDVDGFEDQDGCPDWDNDGDGVPDSRDACPMEAEDKDSVADNDGCPDVDADADGIADEKERCPLAPEDYDGFEDEDGCPEPGTRPEAMTSNAVLDQMVFFETGSTALDTIALATLRSVAHAMLTRPGAAAVVITGHADDRGAEDLNLQLSLARAEAVKAMLVDAGVAAERLQTRGVGQKEPLARPGGLGRALNRSVSFGH
ncbi:MAG: OmpA family protein [Deltaproteobacteria bacterium]|nr:OmpA family protein [Deltaproteobacteria bacterium]